MIRFTDMSDFHHGYQFFMLRPSRAVSLFIITLTLDIIAALAWALTAKMDDVIKTTALLRPLETISTIKAITGGEVVKKNYTQGSFIQEGDILLQLDMSADAIELLNSKKLMERVMENIALYNALLKTIRQGTNKAPLQNEEARIRSEAYLIEYRRFPVGLLLCVLLAGTISADESLSTLERILNAISIDSGIINTRKNYEIALVEQKYRYLQWFRPSMVFNNDLIYPYQHDDFDNLATSNTSSFVFSTPLPTGTAFDITMAYGMNRSLLDPILNHEEWGFTQDVQGKIGIRQSLNPWWVHTRRSPYTRGAALQTELSRNDYIGTIKTVLVSCLQNYIALRKAERNRNALKEKIALYDELLTAYGQMQFNGSISWREYQNIRKDKWEDEQTLFSLEEKIVSLQGELFKISGIRLLEVCGETLITHDHEIIRRLFLDMPKEELRRLEETTIRCQEESLFIERLINRQSNAPSVKFEFGSSFKLPVKETNNLYDAWDGKNFTDNILNNWSFTISLDLSSLFSPLNKRNDITYRLSQNALHELSRSVAIEKEKTRIQNMVSIQQLKDHIKQLQEIIQNETVRIRDDEIMFHRGAITELDYRQSVIDYQSKCVLLENMLDDLWLYNFFTEFY